MSNEFDTKKVMIIEQKRGPENREDGSYPFGRSQRVSYSLRDKRIVRSLKAGDIVEMDLPDAKKYINMGLAKDAPSGKDVTVSAKSDNPELCPVCHTKLKPDNTSGYCCSACERKAVLNQQRDDERRGRKPRKKASERPAKGSKGKLKGSKKDDAGEAKDN